MSAAERIKSYAGIIATIAVAFFVMWLMLLAADAHDPTGYWAREIAAGRAPNAEWWGGLRNKTGGQCCSDADGLSIQDVDWDMRKEQYWVHFHDLKIADTEIPDGWEPVPDDAVVIDPNKYGGAVVWPYIRITNGVTHAGIRCFMPGAGG